GNICQHCNHFPINHIEINDDESSDNYSNDETNIDNNNNNNISKEEDDDENVNKYTVKKPINNNSNRKLSLSPSSLSSLVVYEWLIDYDNFEFKKLIGKGNSSAVYYGTYKGNDVAIKVLRF